MNLAMNVLLEFEVIECCVCGVKFALPPRMLQERRDNGGDVHCPNGHQLGWKDTRVQRLEKELAQERQRHDQTRADRERQKKLREQTERSLSATKGALTRTKNRLASGTCPCCEQRFADLHRHMMDAHPDYEALEDAPEEPRKNALVELPAEEPPPPAP